jgi:trimeric autotransporter adhesin
VASGTASGDIVGSGGFEFVSSGSIDNAVTISGGQFEVASGGSIGSGPVTFSGGGRLLLDASQSFSGLVAGFSASDSIDLKDIAFGSGTTLSYAPASGGTSGTLTVSDGTHIANIELLGNYTAASFTKASDGGAGTLITDSSTLAAAASSASLTTPHA